MTTIFRIAGMNSFRTSALGDRLKKSLLLYMFHFTTSKACSMRKINIRYKDSHTISKVRDNLRERIIVWQIPRIRLWALVDTIRAAEY